MCFHLMEVYYNFSVLDFLYTMINALRVSTLPQARIFVGFQDRKVALIF